MKILLRTFLLLSTLFPGANALGQARFPHGFHGRTTLGLDISSGQNSGLLFYRPPILSRLHTHLHYRKGRWEVPMVATLVWPFALADNRQGPVAHPLDVLGMPGNALGIQPCYRNSLTFLLGTHHVNLSRLSAGDIHFAQGIGISFHPGSFRARISTGLTHRAVPGQGARWLTTAQLGLGNDNRSYLRLNLADASDIARVNPAQSTVLGLDFRAVNNAKTLDWNVEVAHQFQNSAWAGKQSLFLHRGEWRSTLHLRYIAPDFLNLAWFNQVAGHFDIDWRVHRSFLRKRLQLHSYLARRVNWVPLMGAWAGWQRHFQLLGTFRLSKRLHMEGHIDRYSWWNDSDELIHVQQQVKDFAVSLHACLGRRRGHLLSASFGNNQYQDLLDALNGPLAIQYQQGAQPGLQYQYQSARGFGLNAGIHALIGAENPITSMPPFMAFSTAYLGANTAFLRRRLILIGHAQQCAYANGGMTELAMSLQGRLSSRLTLHLQASLRKYTGPLQGPTTFIRTQLQHRF